MNKGCYFKDWKKTALMVLNVGILSMAFAICGLGTYGSAKSIADSAQKHGAFSCGDNSL